MTEINNLKQKTIENTNISKGSSKKLPKAETDLAKKIDGKTLAVVGTAIGAVVAAGILIAKGQGKKALEIFKEGLNGKSLKELENIVPKNKAQKELLDEAISNAKKLATEATPSSTKVSKTTQKAAKEIAQETIQNTNAKTKAKTKLIELYEDAMKKAEKEGNYKRRDNYKMLIRELKDGKAQEEAIYRRLHKQIYNDMRLALYPENAAYNFEIEKITGKSTNLVKVECQGNWHYRVPKNRNKLGWSTSDGIVERISINAKTDEELIKKLDDLISSGQIKGYYKTPCDSPSWLSRHDPITIYLAEKPSNKQLQLIEEITKPHIRSTEDVLFGEIFAPGLALEKSPRKQDMLDLFKEAAEIDPDLETTLRRMFTDKTEDNKLKASSGYITAAKKLMDYLQK